MIDAEPLGFWLGRWDLIADGSPTITQSSRLLPVVHRGQPAMLKIALHPEERWGNEMMVWWDGRGTAPVLGHDGPALLMARALGSRSLAAMASGCADDDATATMCRVAATLHSHGLQPPAQAVPLAMWFEGLWATSQDDILGRAVPLARELLDTQIDIVVLHGDLHHDNVLDFGTGGWRAIDPKGLVGERTFDFVNILRNPDMAVAAGAGRFSRQSALIAAQANVDRERLIRWFIAFSALSAAWRRADGEHPESDLAMLEVALAEVNLGG